MNNNVMNSEANAVRNPIPLAAHKYTKINQFHKMIFLFKTIGHRIILMTLILTLQCRL